MFSKKLAWALVFSFVFVSIEQIEASEASCSPGWLKRKISWFSRYNTTASKVTVASPITHEPKVIGKDLDDHEIHVGDLLSMIIGEDDSYIALPAYASRFGNILPIDCQFDNEKMKAKVLDSDSCGILMRVVAPDDLQTPGACTNGMFFFSQNLKFSHYRDRVYWRIVSKWNQGQLDSAAETAVRHRQSLEKARIENYLNRN